MFCLACNECLIITSVIIIVVIQKKSDDMSMFCVILQLPRDHFATERLTKK